jgi:hypothetical protein
VTEANLEDTVGHFLAFWRAHGKHHFVLEERLVVSALPDDDVEPAKATRRVREQHAEIRTRAAALPRAPSLVVARRLGELLAAHVLGRFALERPSVRIEDLREGAVAFAALAANGGGARRALAALCERHGLRVAL